MKRQKRTTFLRLLARNAAIALTVSALSAAALLAAGTAYVFSEVRNALPVRTMYAQRSVWNAQDSEFRYEDALHFGILESGIYPPVTFGNLTDLQIVPNMTDRCTSVTAILDDDGNILYSNRGELAAVIYFDRTEKQMFFCDPDAVSLPGFQTFIEDYNAMSESETNTTSTQIRLESAYVNRETGSMIPHEAVLELHDYASVIQTKEYRIDMPDTDGYELISTPQSQCDFKGAYPEDFDALFYSEGIQNTLAVREQRNSLAGMYAITDTCRVYYQISDLTIQGRHTTLLTACQIDAWNEVTRPVFWRCTLAFLTVAMGIALLAAWLRHVKNQAEYAYEDYQTDLTNNLAHDLKTPLTAIGGYAENILESVLSAEEQARYLKSILENVRYSDAIISRTLTLNHMEDSLTAGRETVDILKLVQSSLERCQLLLEERSIDVSVSGAAEVIAYAATLETAVENLISNAVKYTAENGSIQITLDPASLCIVNTVSRKVDTADLKKPFVKGDKERGSKQGSGLGLSLADKGAAVNGFRLELSCTETEFTAVLRFGQR